jgi:transcriptional regulator with XRE-family HTH domain
MKIERIHIGQIIEEIVKEQKKTKASFAKSLGIKRQNIEEKVFSKKSIDTDLLSEISEKLGINLFSYYKSDEVCNENNYGQIEVKGLLSIEWNGKKQSVDFNFK